MTKITQERRKAPMPVPAQSHYRGQMRPWAWAEASTPLAPSCSQLKSKAAGSQAICPEFRLKRISGLPPCSPPQVPVRAPLATFWSPGLAPRIRELLARMETPVDASCACRFHVPRTARKASHGSPPYCDSYFTSEEARTPRMSRNASQITQPA